MRSTCPPWLRPPPRLRIEARPWPIVLEAYEKTERYDAQMRVLTLALLLLFAVGASTGSLFAQEAKLQTCTTCAGEGMLEQDCWACHGKKKHGCPTCTIYKSAHQKRWVEVWIPHSLFQAVIDDPELDKKLKELQDISDKLLGGKGKTPKPTEIKAGQIRCPAGCRGGELLHIQDWVDCKVCKSGKFSCEECRKGEVKCAVCSGRGKALGSCDDCAGAGSLPETGDSGVSACPWCKDTEVRKCSSCDAQGNIQTACTSCLGLRDHKCPDCASTGLKSCKQCGGRGRYGPRKAKCLQCDQKGRLDCTTCKKGGVPCTTCKGQPVIAIPCPDCAGKKEHPCNGCAGLAYRAWIFTGESLMANDRAEEAVPWFEEARNRCELRYTVAVDYVVEKYDQDRRDDFEKAVQKELKDELRRIDGLIKKAEKAAAR